MREESCMGRVRGRWLLGLDVALAGCTSSAGSGSSGDRSAEAAEPAQVAWQEWTPATFEAARAQGRLVLVDAIAGWCHWCHVMDERTYGDPAVARLLAERFVVVR